MGISHAFFGFGALVCPLVATQFAQDNLQYWNYFYLCTMGLAVLSAVTVGAVYRFRREEDIFRSAGYVGFGSAISETAQVESATQSSKTSIDDPMEPPTLDVDPPSALTTSKYKRTFTTPLVYMAALYNWIYVGIEIAIGGWVVTYIIKVRGGNSHSGYVSSGYFGKLALGRLAQIWMSKCVSRTPCDSFPDC